MGLVYHIFLKLQYYMGYKINYFINYFIFYVQEAINITVTA